MTEAPQQSLMNCLLQRDLEAFQELLETKNKHGYPLVDVNYVYDSPHYMTCLAKAAYSKEDFEKSAQFIRILLRNGADPNLRFAPHNNYGAVHFAVERNNLPALQALLQNGKTNPNIRNKRNQTPVYLAAALLPRSAECFKCLIFHPKVDIKIDTTKLTAVGKAAEKNCDLETLRQIITFVNYLRTDDKIIISEKYPDIDISDIPDENDDVATTSKLYRYLELNQVEEFKKEIHLFMKSIDDPNESIKKAVELMTADDNLKMTCLQLACWNGYYDVVEFLVNLGVDMNATTENERRPPIHLACYKGNLSILVFLVNNGAGFSIVDGKTLLHSIFIGLIPTREEHKMCFDYLLQKNSKPEFLNHEDEYGHTALHYAILEKDDHYATELLKHGAYIGVKNSFGISPLHDMNPATLETALDNCIERVEKDQKSQQYTLKVNFKIFKPCNASKNVHVQDSEVGKGESLLLKPIDTESGKICQQQLPEMYPLCYISQSKKLQHLLKHPILLMFLHLKWKRIIMIFLLNIIFFTVFVIFLTADIFCTTCDRYGFVSNSCMPAAAGIVRIILYIFFATLILREAFQLLMLPDKLKYFKSLENLLELGIIVTTVLILIGFCSKFLTAVSLILSWTELILQFGCIQRLAVYNEMLKRVTWNYMKFLLWYLPLIMAFTFSFYKLYHVDETLERQDENDEAQNISTNSSSNEDENKDFYSDFSLSFLKTVVMMIGEYDASDMKFTQGGKIVFLFFVFMITIVLLNLLNGVAVSDTQAIRDEAELVILRFRVKLLYHFESVLFRSSPGGLSAYLPWRKHLMKRVSLFPEAFPNDCLLRELTVNKQIGRYLSRKEWKGKDSEHRPDECFTFGKWRFGFYIDPAIFDAAKDIADRIYMEDDTSQMQLLKQEVQDIKTEISEIRKLLDEFVDKKQLTI